MRLAPFLIIVSAHAAIAMTGRPQYKQFYPGLGIERILQHNCSRVYERYKAGECPGNHTDSVTNDDCKDQGAIDVAQCLLEKQIEVNKANMAEAAFVLGLMPIILSIMGPTTIETGILGLRRPFLAFLLSTGSPSVSVLRSFDYGDPVELLRFSNRKSYKTTGATPGWSILISCLQYASVLGAVANVVLTVWQLSVRTVTSLGIQTANLPITWALLAVPIHLTSMIAVYFRARLKTKNQAQGLSAQTPQTTSVATRFINLLHQEFQPCSSLGPGTLSIGEESMWFVLVNLWTSTSAVLHLVFGTMVLSGTLFISSGDAVGIVGRLLLSTLVCRVVLTAEMRGIRRAISLSNYPEDVEVHPLVNLKPPPATLHEG